MCDELWDTIQSILETDINNWKYVHHEILKGMMTMNNTWETFDAVHFMRQQRSRLSEILSKMTKEEIIEYFRTKALKSTIKPYC